MEYATPGQPAYADATATYNLAHPPRPRGAAVARSVDEVVDAVRTARRLRRRLFVQTTGHSSGSFAPMTDGLLVRTALTTPVRVDVARRVATVPAGALWNDVLAASAPHGLVPPHGSSGDVGAIGYLVRGGMSFYGRQVGVAANLVRSLTVVLADGSVTTVDATHDPELFWALRGGDGGFGIVVSADVELLPMAYVFTGRAFWEMRDASGVVAAWQRWTRTAPERASTSLRFLELPALPGVPPEIVGRPVLGLDGAISVGTDHDVRSGKRILAEMRAPLYSVARPTLDTWGLAAPAELPLTHMDPPVPIDYRGDHFLLGDLGDDGVDALVGAVSGSRLAVVELRQLGGAFARAATGAGALATLQGAYACLALGVAGPGLTDRDNLDRMRYLREQLTPWQTGFTAPTFVDDYEQPQRSWDDATAARVSAIRDRVDPFGLFAGLVAPIREKQAV